MKYQANPVIVDAFQIAAIGEYELGVGTPLTLDSGENVVATFAMTTRMTPVAGDYWVIQSDGYIYLNPKDVFERKYRPMDNAQIAGGA